MSDKQNQDNIEEAKPTVANDGETDAMLQFVEQKKTATEENYLEWSISKA